MELYTCSKCGFESTPDNFCSKHVCKGCKRRYDQKYYIDNKKHKIEYDKQWRLNNPDKSRAISTRNHRKRGAKPMSKNRACASFLGIHVAERVLSNVFMDVAIIPISMPVVEVIFNKGYKIDVKSSCIRHHKKWADDFAFNINKNIFKEYTFKEIKESLNEKSNNTIQLAISKFKSENLITDRKIGNSILYKLNLNEDSVFDYITIFDNSKLSKNAKQSIMRVKEEVNKITPFFSIIVFGSYAKRMQKKDSDIDIAIIAEGNKEKIKAQTNIASDKSIIPIDIHLISKSEFLEMLNDTKENLGKQIARNHLAIHNSKIFYSILIKGANNGFVI